MKKLHFILSAITVVAVCYGAIACTGITLESLDGAKIVARTIETGYPELNSEYVVVPRGHTESSYLPDGTKDGMIYTSRYGYVAFTAVEPEFLVDGLNEAGLAAALFYFPQYGKYPEYNPIDKSKTIADLQLVGWALGNFSNVEQVKNAIKNIRPTGLYPDSGTVHWRFTDASGRQIVLEYIDGEPVFYENELGVLTNAPDFDWQMKNLNNYVNLFPKAIESHDLGLSDVKLSAFGAGAGLLGLPGDFTPASRFVRAAFLQTSAAPQPTGYDTVLQSFHILNNFDIPVETEYGADKMPEWMPSATQWTVATDITNRRIYYHTMYNRAIREIDLGAINFETVKYQAAPMDAQKTETIIKINIAQ